MEQSNTKPWMLTMLDEAATLHTASSHYLVDFGIAAAHGEMTAQDAMDRVEKILRKNFTGRPTCMKDSDIYRMDAECFVDLGIAAAHGGMTTQDAIDRAEETLKKDFTVRPRTIGTTENCPRTLGNRPRKMGSHS